MATQINTLLNQLSLSADITFVMVTHSVSDGLLVVAKDHPEETLQPSDFPGIDPDQIREEP